MESQTVVSCSVWKLNLGPLEDWSVLLATEPSLQPQEFYFVNCVYVSVCEYQDVSAGAQGYQRYWFPAAGVIGGCEPLNVSKELNLVLWKTLNCLVLSSPFAVFKIAIFQIQAVVCL